MSRERETAYPLVFGFVALLVVALVLAAALHRRSPKVTMVLTHPAPYQK